MSHFYNFSIGMPAILAAIKYANMKSMISIVEIPTVDFTRARTFYQSLLDIEITEIDMQGTLMGLFPSDDQAVAVALVKGDDYKPSESGSLVYLNAGDDLQKVLDKVNSLGGNVVIGKTMIPDSGFFAMFIDTEGNKLGLFSIH